ncbi:MAG: hypothetical protein KF802_07105 [Bdellovibrionaceae bacterium]|nr:hypothetical protein [Pseudobdellovibrionaceae bacterium]MBX3033061.1 hypothetical protein [Pseudobdellovibrionaceae bacterium]
MDLKKINGLENLMPQTPGAPPKAPAGIGPSFRETLNQVSGPAGSTAPIAVPQNGMAKAAGGIKFSNHAIERMQTRGISFKPEDLQRLGDAVSRAAAKGSKDSLILMNESALIVSVKNNTVVTVMDKNALKENVFTNIDSTIVM